VGEMRVRGARLAMARRADDGELAGERIGAAEAVDLPLVGRAEHTEDRPTARVFTGRQVALLEEHSFAGSATHDHASEFVGHVETLLAFGEAGHLGDGRPARSLAAEELVEISA